jgi:GNAT superfamily N-acetyltransferase
MSRHSEQPLSVGAGEASDAEAIAPLLAQLGYPSSPDEVRERLARLAARADAGVLVADLAGEIVGVAGYQVMDLLERSQPQCRITTLVVRDDRRRCGAATALLDAIESAARAHGCFRLEVTTRPRRADATGFYFAVGFQERPLRLVKPLG